MVPKHDHSTVDVPSRALRWALLAAILVFCTGCAKDYVLVKLHVNEALHGGGEAEISSTATYRDKLDEVKVVAIRLPEHCVTESAGVATGRSRQTDVTMQTTCGVSLSELERSMVRAGYRVISWDTVHRMERSRNMSTYKAASELGIDAILIINSLGSDAVGIDDLSQLVLSYYYSNPNAEALKPARLPSRSRQAIRKMLVNSRYQGRDRNAKTMLAATLDINVVLVETGEAIWYYRRTMTHNLIDEKDRAFLLRGRDIYYRPVRPRWMVESASLDSEQNVDVLQQASAGGQSDHYRALKHELERAVSADFVEKFRSGMY